MPLKQRKPPNFSKTLKTSAKYLVSLADDGFVYKTAQPGLSLATEVRVIDQLVANNKHISGLNYISVVDYGRFSGGPLHGCEFYTMPYVTGGTLSEAIRSNSGIDQNRIAQLLKGIADAVNIPASIDKSSTAVDCISSMMPKVVQELESVKRQEPRAIDVQIEVLIAEWLRQISKMLEPCRFLTIPKANHLNFHADNIIVSSDHWSIIDPDVSLSGIDPVFGIARLAYSQIHDSIEYGFSVESNLGVDPELVANYDYSLIARDHIQAFFDAEIENFTARFSLSYIYCLIRGARINHSSTEPHTRGMGFTKPEALIEELRSFLGTDFLTR